MPIVIPKDLPAYEVLTKENVFVMNNERAVMQDIRPIEIAILNLMPTKIDTENQLLRLLGNTPLQVNITLLKTSTYKGKNTKEEHLERFYKNFGDVKDRKFDGMIITGAPVETLAFDDVRYWEELKQILKFADEMVTSTIYICWGAQAALYYHYGIDKKTLPKKVFGVFKTKRTAGTENELLLKGIDDTFYIPHSRHTCLMEDSVYAEKNIKVLAVSEGAGISIAKSLDNKKIFLTGHSEYDRETLKNEYTRDVDKKLDIAVPINYFVADDPSRQIEMKWISAGNIIFSNWLNHYVYQVTPYKLLDT